MASCRRIARAARAVGPHRVPRDPATPARSRGSAVAPRRHIGRASWYRSPATAKAVLLMPLPVAVLLAPWPVLGQEFGLAPGQYNIDTFMIREPPNDLQRSTLYVDYASGETRFKRHGEPFAQLLKLDDVVYEYVGVATAGDATGEQCLYAMTQLRGAGLYSLTHNGKDFARDKRIRPGEAIAVDWRPGWPAARAYVWTGTTLKQTWAQVTDSGEVRRDAAGNPLVEERIILGNPWRFATREEREHGIVRGQTALYRFGDAYYEVTTPVDREGRLDRSRLRTFHRLSPLQDGDPKVERDAKPFVLARSLMGEYVLVSADEPASVPILVDGENCRQRFRWGRNAVETDVLRKDRSVSRFPVNRDAMLVLHWARVGSNTSYVPVDGFWYEKAYVVDSKGHVTMPLRYFGAGWDEQGSVSRGTQAFVQAQAGSVVEDY